MPYSLSLPISPWSLSDEFFGLNSIYREGKLVMKMDVRISSYTTSAFPRTKVILERELPSILTAKCFNELKQPFYKEVENTEIGHLFEHIFLAYLYDLKIVAANSTFTYNGVTKWNWRRDPEGVFHIEITGIDADYSLVPYALEQSVKLLKKIMKSIQNR